MTAHLKNKQINKAVDQSSTTHWHAGYYQILSDRSEVFTCFIMGNIYL